MATSNRSLPVRPFSQITERSVGWLWRGRLPLGKLVILDGDPGLGKTLLTLDFCARVTTGRPFPGDGPAIGPVNVLLLNAEDALEDTLKPRLQGMGADLERVFGIDEEEYGLSEPPRFPADQAALGQALARTQARLVIIDPVVAFLERTIQSGNDQSVRSALLPLAGLARQHQCAIVLVRHLNKSGGLRSLYRGGGSIGFLGTCRTAWLVAADPQHPEQRVLAQVKNNIAPPQLSLAFRVDEPYAGRLTVTWLGESGLTADQLLERKPGAEAPPRQREIARDWLEDFLDEAPRTSAEVWQSAEQAGLSERTLFRAKSDLDVTTERVKLPGQRLSYWLLPHQQLPHDVKMAAAQQASRDMLERLRTLGQKHAPQATKTGDNTHDQGTSQ